MNDGVINSKNIYWGKSYSISQGRDPLGMQKGSIATYGLLVPGLTNLTKRIRYYGYYCWLLNFFEVNILNNEDNQAEAFKLFIRGAEYLLAIIMMKIDPDITGVSGSRFAWNYVKTISTERKNDDFTVDIASGADKNVSNDDLYFNNPYGAFRQYYVGQMQYLGLIKTEMPSWSEISPSVDTIGNKIPDEWWVCAESGNDYHGFVLKDLTFLKASDNHFVDFMDYKIVTTGNKVKKAGNLNKSLLKKGDYQYSSELKGVEPIIAIAKWVTPYIVKFIEPYR